MEVNRRFLCMGVFTRRWTFVFLGKEQIKIKISFRNNQSKTVFSNIYCILLYFHLVSICYLYYARGSKLNTKNKLSESTGDYISSYFFIQYMCLLGHSNTLLYNEMQNNIFFVDCHFFLLCRVIVYYMCRWDTSCYSSCSYSPYSSLLCLRK